MTNRETSKDVVLIGAGIMSATLGSLLKELAPDWNIKVFEKLDKTGGESSNVWNNAGTGHAALCELNYTKEQSDGSIDISKAIKINEQFQITKQYWSYLLSKGYIHNPEEFVRSLPHMSLVHGRDNINFLKKRYETMTDHPLFKGMEFSEDPEKLKEWIPLIMKNRTLDEPVAATRMETGTDVNFGTLTEKMFDHLESQDVQLHYNQRVDDVKRADDGSWMVKVQHMDSDQTALHSADFVFVGGGGGSLHLLQKSGVPEGKGFGGFPVSGQFMVCNNPEVAKQHEAKVYGKAAAGAPPMSVPHLDTRYIDNEQSLLFGPFAGFSPKFLKAGSLADLFTSIKISNILTMLAAGVKEISLTKYLIGQVLQTKEQRMEALREFIPDAKSEDWDLVVAGQRVQVIKDTEEGGKGTLQFGTEIVNSADGSIAALLGASPGASTAVHVMMDVLDRCFPQYMDEWEPKLTEMVPSYGKSLSEHQDLLNEIHSSTARTLGLKEKEPVHQ
ncbi:malate:quinone oxidoreductase [Halobacillus halophilus]|uniref:Probable malate:quinone oxidoreductase n=1 Tax=Halobacillus halophilus (strain ATCC 35676 / DSM 2266 / JCM 20832 / KCTC 3685 / LMG 17431 / NBRC 102448 / NCIMB 2269) TaxID=866895 RepID=I0JTA3_HALH3|nr:malate:quinone oxidoreductase [Halobacillus halophilus]ASF41291.1 malate:quinone oxidoreductase [Halobacillus halophilus]CCG47375.1 malate dehydrogenase (quinone) [Halobacillus halophilus DSM 2266]